MEKEKKSKEQLLREKSDNYVVCFNAACNKHEHCLRWQVGQHVSERVWMVKCVNQRYAPVVAGQFDCYRDDKPLVMPVGMKEHFYDDIPLGKARQIKRTLISDYGRTVYYRYHSGLLPIPPQVQAHIQMVCRLAGQSLCTSTVRRRNCSGELAKQFFLLLPSANDCTHT